MTLYATGALEAQAPPAVAVLGGRLDLRRAASHRHRRLVPALGVPRQQSPHTDHQPYTDAPELSDW